MSKYGEHCRKGRYVLEVRRENLYGPGAVPVRWYDSDSLSDLFFEIREARRGFDYFCVVIKDQETGRKRILR